MIWSVSWKNVWRSKIRSSVVITAFIIGVFGGLFTVAVMVGSMEQRVKLAIGNEVSHLQIHNPQYLENNELKYTINDFLSLQKSLEAQPNITAYSPRIKIMGMASTSGSASGILINGVDVEKERQVSGIANSIIDGAGNYFDDSRQKSIVIGEKLAKTLKLAYYMISDKDLEELMNNKKFKEIVPLLDTLKNVRYRTEKDFEVALGSVLGKNKTSRYSFNIKRETIKYKLNQKIVLSFQALDGHIAYDAFRIAGVYKTANTAFDGFNVYVRNIDIMPVANMAENQFNEIAVLLSSVKYDTQLASELKSKFPDLSIQTWDEILPEAGMYSKAMNYYLFIFMSIILLALGFGIVNTMLMAVLERVKELGMLMSIGMNKKRVFTMIMLETVFLSLIGAIAGMIISYVIIWYTGKHGIDLSALYQEGLEAIGFSAHIFPKLGLSAFVELTLLVILTGIIASIYPARKALKLNPAEALRIDM
jgi:ABC-type lipoprotein release transport system permease subunit